MGYAIGHPVTGPGGFRVQGDLLLAGSLARRKSHVVCVTENTWVTAEQTGVTFLVTGGEGVSFMLPLTPEGLVYEFINLVDEPMEVATDLYAIWGKGTKLGQSAYFDGSAKIGAACRVIGISQAWIAMNLSDLPMTIGGK